MQIDLSPDLKAVLTDLQAEIRDLRTEIVCVRAELKSKPDATAVPRDWYSVDELARQLGKSPYTCREWCRHGQIRAAKRAECRGCSALWSVSADEVTRYRNEGLLPIDPERNATN